MKKLLPFFYALLIVSSSSCGGHDHAAEAAAGEAQITRKVLDSEVSKTVANLSISGMTCAAGCGGKIQQELRGLAGVNTTDLDFQENRPENVVTVEFDPEKVNEQGLIECDNKIADGAYHVNKVELIQYRGLQSHGRSTDAGVSENYIGRAAQVMDLLRSLSHIVQ